MASGNKMQRLSIPVDGPNRETDNAHGVSVNGVMVWFPKSQIQEFEIIDRVISFWCPEWLIEAKSCEIFIDTSHEPSLF